MIRCALKRDVSEDNVGRCIVQILEHYLLGWFGLGYMCSIVCGVGNYFSL